VSSSSWSEALLLSSRAVMLAKPVDATKVAAEYKDGVLKIALPKVKADQAPQKDEIE